MEEQPSAFFSLYLHNWPHNPIIPAYIVTIDLPGAAYAKRFYPSHTMQDKKAPGSGGFQDQSA
ncbi:hypothetical protein CE91St56_09750 [Lachnospiraceae bacterium]|nr:hypothetical protein CE91St56_09750 [Lachnospiraceae bacterium]GKH39915.1 hypothetical protein CE91St57_08890 [Lachnospiraceae bacterium]